MASEVDICNIALGWLGANLITSLNDNTKQANLCQVNYPNLRDALMASYDWTFAMERFTPTPKPDHIRGDFEFEVPSNILRVVDVYRDEFYVYEFARDDWYMEGERRLYAPRQLVYAKGVKNLVITAEFTPTFVQALAARLAADLCIPITENRQLQGDMWGLFNDKITEAYGTDIKRTRRKKRVLSPLIAARHRGARRV